MNIIELESLALTDIDSVVNTQVDKFLKTSKISLHKSVNPTTCLSWINYIKPFDFISFTVTKNPFSIYLGKYENDKQTLAELKPIDYSFPMSCVTPEVSKYMESFIDELNTKFKFTDFKYEKNVSDEQKIMKFRHFFNFPKGSKSDHASNIASVRIDLPQFDKKGTYDLLIHDLTKNEMFQPLNKGDLLERLPRYNSYKLYIKPSRIVSSSVYFPGEFKMMWQVYKIDVISCQINDLEFLKGTITKTPIENEGPSLSNQIEEYNNEDV